MKLKYAGLFIFAYHLFLPVFASQFKESIPQIYNGDENSDKILDTKYFNKNKENFYILGPGDSIEIKVSPDYPELDAIRTINGEGKIYSSLLGTIHIEGLTIDELVQLLNQAFIKTAKFPNAEVLIRKYRPITIRVEGEVNNPGLHTISGSKSLKNNSQLINMNMGISSRISAYPLGEKYQSEITDNYENSLTSGFESTDFFPSVFDALRKSGGITSFSDLSNIQIIRKNSISNGGGKITTNLNFEKLMDRGDNTQNIRIYDDDIIIVNKLETSDQQVISKAVKANLNPKYIRVFVTGRVNSGGGLITLGKTSTLNDAIDVAGGVKTLRGNINYLTFGKDGTISKSKINYSKRSKPGSSKNPFLKEGDIITVGNSALSEATELLSEITSPLQGVYSTYRLIELIN